MGGCKKNIHVHFGWQHDRIRIMSEFSQKLDFRQSQNLVMTPQLQQAIKLLQLNNIELAEFVEEELEKNPLLEKAEPEAPEEEKDWDSEPETANDEMPLPSQDEFDSKSDLLPTGSGGALDFNDAETSFENTMSRPESLREHLHEQLGASFSDPQDQMIGALLIDSLDEAGYLRLSVTELSERLDCSTERIGRLLDILKQFDPAGIFARDLKECLSLQLADQKKLDPPMVKFLEHLDLLADHNVKKLAKICDVNETYLEDMIADIRALNPKPAALFDHVVAQTAIPDIFMKRLPKHVGGGWHVELNTQTLPRVLVNNEYYTQIANSAHSKKDKEYISTQMNAASWLVKAMDQRAQTILKVAGEIIERQSGFFNYGIEFLVPLTLKDIADEIDMHESTVSRVTTNKFIGTPRGTFELKYFFTTALVSEDGSSVSAESVKSQIKNMIDAETVKTILSDDKIAEILQEKGIHIARRTVAKYREAMHIPSSVQRRKQKKNNA